MALFGSFVGFNMNLIDIQKNIEKASQEVGLIKKIDYLKPDVERFDEIVKALVSNPSLDGYLKNPISEKKESLTSVFYAIAMSNNLLCKLALLMLRK